MRQIESVIFICDEIIHREFTHVELSRVRDSLLASLAILKTWVSSSKISNMWRYFNYQYSIRDVHYEDYRLSAVQMHDEKDFRKQDAYWKWIPN